MSEYDIVAEWLQVAFDDYDSALYLFQKPHRRPHEIICYHCRQSAEKALKAFLCAHGVDIPRTHDTGFLCRLCVDIDNSFSRVLESCEELAIYATETRYPIRIEIDEATVKRNLKQTYEIYCFVTDIVSIPNLNIEICKLLPELAEDYVKFFDETPHDDNVDEHKCYCVCWCNDDCEGKDFSSREKRRTLALQYVKGGNIQGYLAYHDGKVVGWVNANTKSDCYKCVSWRRQMGHVPTEESAPGIRVKSVYCFVVAPEMKRKGIATRLLKHICQDAAQDGFDFVEAYPNKGFANDIDFTGPIDMYIKSGFVILYQDDHRLVVRKQL
jgi:HEPN domain-containing protein/GNAT superfamily N-acetyltransferase